MIPNLLSLDTATGRVPLRIEQPLPLYKQCLMACIVAVWAISGIFGRDPWKPVETEVSAAIKGMLDKEEIFQIPTLLGSQILDTPPLYYWLTGIFSALRPEYLEIHEAARLANLLLLFVALLCLGTAINLAAHRRFAWDGILLLAGTMGLLFDFHLLNTHIMAMAGVSVQLLGLSLLQRRALPGGALFGLGAALAFWSAGLLALNMSLLCLLLLPLLSRKWLGTSVLISLLVASFFLVPAIGLWLTVLGGAEPGSTAAWLVADRHNWLQGNINPFRGSGGVAENLIWSSWPLWPIIAIGFATSREKMLNSTGIQAGLAMSLAVLLSLIATPFPANSEVFLLYPPMALVAALSLMRSKLSLLRAFDWFALMAISFATVALIWICWLIAASGWPPDYAKEIASLRPGVQINTPPLALAIAVCTTVGWIALLAKINRGIHRPIVNWSCGLALAWLLFCLLWLDYMDAGRSYRQVGSKLEQAYADLKRKHPEEPCVQAGNLFRSEAAQLYYFSGVPLAPEGSDCPYWVERSEIQAANGVPLGGRNNRDRILFYLHSD